MLQQIDRGVGIPRQGTVNLFLRGIRERDKLLNRCGGIGGNSDEIGKTIHGHSHDRITRVSRGNCHTRRFFNVWGISRSDGEDEHGFVGIWTYGNKFICRFSNSRLPEW